MKVAFPSRHPGTHPPAGHHTLENKHSSLAQADPSSTRSNGVGIVRVETVVAILIHELLIPAPSYTLNPSDSPLPLGGFAPLASGTLSLRGATSSRCSNAPL